MIWMAVVVAEESHAHSTSAVFNLGGALWKCVVKESHRGWNRVAKTMKRKETGWSALLEGLELDVFVTKKKGDRESAALAREKTHERGP